MLRTAVPDLSDRRVLESTLWVLTSVVEDTSLLVDVVKLKRLQLTTLSELNIFQSFDVNDDAVWLSLGDCLLNLEVSELKLVSETNAAIHHRLGHHVLNVGSDNRVRQVHFERSCMFLGMFVFMP